MIYIYIIERERLRLRLTLSRDILLWSLVQWGAHTFTRDYTPIPHHTSNSLRVVLCNSERFSRVSQARIGETLLIYHVLELIYQEWPRQTKPKKGQFMNFPQGHSGTKFRCESCLFSWGKNTRIHKNGRNSWTFRFGPFFGLVCRGDSWI